MKVKYSLIAKNRSRTLRKRMTDAELKLWKHLRKKQINNLQFYRQKPLGKYIVDFYCPAKRMVIEVDGGQHYGDKVQKYDNLRTKYLNNDLGMQVLRFSNLEVLQEIDEVLEKIFIAGNEQDR